MSVTRSDYLYIERWGQMMGSSGAYISDQLVLARRDRAPRTATYKSSSDSEWRTIEDVAERAAETRHYFTARGWMTPDWRVPAQDARIMAEARRDA